MFERGTSLALFALLILVCTLKKVIRLLLIAVFTGAFI